MHFLIHGLDGVKDCELVDEGVEHPLGRPSGFSSSSSSQLPCEGLLAIDSYYRFPLSSRSFFGWREHSLVLFPTDSLCSLLQSGDSLHLTFLLVCFLFILHFVVLNWEGFLIWIGDLSFLIYFCSILCWPFCIFSSRALSLLHHLKPLFWWSLCPLLHIKVEAF